METRPHRELVGEDKGTDTLRNNLGFLHEGEDAPFCPPTNLSVIVRALTRACKDTYKGCLLQ